MRDRNNIDIKVGDKIYIPKPIEIIDGCPFQDCWIANVDSIETIKGKEFLYAYATNAKKAFKVNYPHLKEGDFLTRKIKTRGFLRRKQEHLQSYNP